MLDSLSSSSSSSVDCSILSCNSSMSSSSSSSSLSSLLSSSSEEQEHSLLQLSMEVQRQANIVIAPFQDHSVNWGRGPVVADLSQSACVENCCMWKEHLITICKKLWPQMRHLFKGTRTSIKCHNQYNTHFEMGMIILLYRM